MEHKKNYSARLLMGIILVGVGLILLFANVGMLDWEIKHVVFSWPFILFVIGLVSFLSSSRKGFGLIAMLVGGFFLLPRIFPWMYFDIHMLWPILLIVLGGYLIIRRAEWGSSKPNFFHRRRTAVNADQIDDTAIFGGGEKTFVSDNFQGGKITAVFGGSEIDLSKCKLAPGEHVIDTFAAFGGWEIYIPKDWRVVVDVLPIFGGFSEKGLREPDESLQKDRTLFVKGFVIFGGGEIKRV
jgi:predicted membrane protein